MASAYGTSCRKDRHNHGSSGSPPDVWQGNSEVDEAAPGASTPLLRLFRHTLGQERDFKPGAFEFEQDILAVPTRHPVEGKENDE